MAVDGLTRDEKLKESQNDPPRTDDTAEDRSLEPGLRPGDPDVYGEPLERYPGDDIPWWPSGGTFSGDAGLEPGDDGHRYEPERCGERRQRNEELLV